MVLGWKEVEADGKTVVLYGKEAIESVKFMVDFWKEAHDEGGLAWDDSSNNRAFLAGTICATNNGASIYIEAKRKPAIYLDETGKPLKDDIQHAPLPAGPAGQFSYHGTFQNAVMKYSKNQTAAKEFIRWMSSKPIFEKWFVSQKLCDRLHDRLGETPAVHAAVPLGSTQRAVDGLCGPAQPQSRRGAEQVHYRRHVREGVQGMPAEEAVRWAHEEVAKAYT